MKTLYIKKTDGLRIAIPNTKLLAAWSITERDILEENSNIDKRIAAHKETLLSLSDVAQKQSMQNEIDTLEKSKAEVSPYGIALIGYEKEREPLKLVKIANEINSIFESLPDKSNYSLYDTDGGNAITMNGKIVGMEEISLPAYKDDTFELPTIKVTHVDFSFGEDHNRRLISIRVLNDIETIK